MIYSTTGCTSSAKLSPGCATNPHSTPAAYPQARTHQNKIVEAIQHILLMPPNAFNAYCRNDAFAKTIRNYQYIVEEQESICPYLNKKWGPIYFRKTVEAVNHLKTTGAHAGPAGGLHYEHAVPVAMVKERLKFLRSTSYPSSVPTLLIRDTVESSEIILITTTQQKKLDGSTKNDGLGLQTTMPDTALGKPWAWGVDCHLARICKLDTLGITGSRLIG